MTCRCLAGVCSSATAILESRLTKMESLFIVRNERLPPDIKNRRLDFKIEMLVCNMWCGIGDAMRTGITMQGNLLNS